MLVKAQVYIPLFLMSAGLLNDFKGKHLCIQSPRAVFVLVE
jgi:hypothetical protein